MNTKFIASSLIAVAALASSAAFADEVDSRTAPFVSQFSRAEVQADYFKAVKEGTLPVLADAAAETPSTINSGVTRTEVKAQAVQWAYAKNKPTSEIM